MLSLTPLGHFQAFGFVLLKQFFDPALLAAEVDQALERGVGAEMIDGAVAQFAYAPMLDPSFAASWSLFQRAEAIAREWLGVSVVPTRIKAVRYSGDTAWHADSDSSLCSIGMLAYLEPLRAETGALRVLPGSQQPTYAEQLQALLAKQSWGAAALPAHVIDTEPGDLIVFDEHLYHASAGGDIRRQWRIDFLPDPLDPTAEALTKAYFAEIFPPDWDAGYDVEQLPCYGAGWLNSGHPSVPRLEALGVYDLARVQEAFTAAAAKRRRSASC